jgi:K+-sensing histidine kinase KdpD
MPAGIGLTPGAQERIFEPFGRAANATRQGLPGLGLGLHICRQIATAYGGRMWVQSDGEGQGMLVGMCLPPTPTYGSALGACGRYLPADALHWPRQTLPRGAAI